MLVADGLSPLPKTSGSKGMQVSAPVIVDNAAQTSDYAHDVAQRLEKALPNLAISRMSKSLRSGKVFVDWSQNNPAKTTVAPYSLRARPQPTASTPLTWDEVETGGSLVFTAPDVRARVEANGDLFADVLSDTLRARPPLEPPAASKAPPSKDAKATKPAKPAKPTKPPTKQRSPRH